MRIGTNITALRGHNNLTKVNDLKSKSLEKLSTGKRINSASDDAAGMSVATKLDSKIQGLQMAVRNTLDGCSMVETSEAVLGEVTDILQRLRELCVQTANDTYGADERDKTKVEIDELVLELDRISGSTKFNGINLLDGNAVDLVLQVGADKGDTLELSFPSVASTDLGVDALDISTSEKAQDSIETLDDALSTLMDERSRLGATINRLNYTVSNLNTMIESMSSAHSRVIDTDMSLEMMNFTKNNILSQSSTSMLSQAMQMPNAILSLLQQ